MYYHIFCTVYSLYEFVDDKGENKLKSNQNQQRMRFYIL